VLVQLLLAVLVVLEVHHQFLVHLLIMQEVEVAVVTGLTTQVALEEQVEVVVEVTQTQVLLEQ
jgi:hypothetical protein